MLIGVSGLQSFIKAILCMHHAWIHLSTEFRITL